MERQALRDRVHRYNHAGPDGLTNRNGAGRGRYLGDTRMSALDEIVETGPDPAVDGVVRRRRIDLKRVIEERSGLFRADDLRPSFRSRLCPYRPPPAAPRAGCARHRDVQKRFASTLRAHISDLPAGTPAEIRFQNAARPGQNNGLTRLWAKKGGRPAGPPIGAIAAPVCSAPSVRLTARGRRSCRLGRAPKPCRCPRMRSAAMSLARCMAVIPMDRAGWRTTGKLEVPKNLTIILLPSRSPERNPVENIWQYLRANWLSNRVSEDYKPIINTGCEAWNKRIAQPETITSIGTRKWANIG